MKIITQFLTTTSICLIIASIAATKANGRIASRCYTENPITHKCTVDSGINCPGGSNNCLNGLGQQLFAKDINNGCSVQLKEP